MPFEHNNQVYVSKDELKKLTRWSDNKFHRLARKGIPAGEAVYHQKTSQRLYTTDQARELLELYKPKTLFPDGRPVPSGYLPMKPSKLTVEEAVSISWIDDNEPRGE